MKNEITLTLADDGMLQDAWHYAMLIIKRRDSGFDGDREFAEGIRGQITAYERLLAIVSTMTSDNETYQIQGFGHPQTFENLVAESATLLEAINQAAARLGIDAHSGSKVMTAAEHNAFPKGRWTA